MIGPFRERNERNSMSRSPQNLWIAALAGWLVPGAGHFLIGMKAKGVFFFVVIVGAFVGGLVLAEFHAVDYDRHPIYFLAFLFNGLVTLLAWTATSSLEVTDYITQESLGTLYCAVASLLNILVVLDIFACAERQGGNAVAKQGGVAR